jgi:serine phosphatase RsbU (regulator of sigma subunit)
LMPAESFGIGIYNQAGNCIDFDGIIEKEQILPYHFESLSDTHSLAAYCFNNQKAILLNDVSTEISYYTGSSIPNTNTAALPQSLIYQPLMFGNKPIGVLTAQSFLPNAYTKRDAMLLATLASYIAIAFDNAKVYRIIKIKNEQITDSIHYAKTIQQAILPSEKLINSLFKDNFIIFYPKDIVSGDFYWLHHVQTATQNLTFIAVVDCTGHGVPGALMSMIGNTLLNEIVIKKEIYEPKLILESLNDSIRVYLKQDENENHDGMDICLCRITPNQEHYEISYAGAKRPLFVMKNGILKELKGSRKSIGGIQDTNREFTQENIVLTPNDCIYLCSDGFIDQNNKTRERFSTHRLTDLIRLYSKLSCAEQKELIEKAFHQFKGESLQRDDVSLIGIKL